MDKYQKYDVLFFSRIDWNSRCQIYQNLASYMTDKGHRIFYFNPNFLSKHLNIDKINEKLNVLTLSNKFGKSIYNIDFNDKLEELRSQLENIIQNNYIKDCVLFVEDPMWICLAKSLKEKYNFKIIFNYEKEKDESIISVESEDFEEVYEKIENNIKDIHGLVSVVIVTFNNLNYTRECIQSIFEKTAYPNYEIIIIDNNSQDNTPIYLKELEKQHSNITIVLNEQNYGFAKGNNVGIKKAKGDYIILLNNDTVVTRGWITAFIKHLEKDDKLGLVGPVTNYAGNEAMINVSYRNMKEMDRFAQRYTLANFNKLYNDINMLIMFCVAMKKELINEVGYLDEHFRIGMFEDDDFSYRVKNAGYKIAYVKDIFIHHYGSASFKKLGRQKFIELFNENKKIFEKKWNIKWSRHKYRR
ncbi:glycosyltransferase [Tepidibacter hydrothermalis]|uniref:Glycosyltransferase n=1 Tax=Tepidibacter hydrothermalis TaxID=3036126 RepID=A0ABY8EEL3_9FIRM|nr:glycosyltransferase [Tepidibacter hydrothermalis]WFD11394.1 glycosyltransferase [Tepidibacter hydrothermalis]